MDGGATEFIGGRKVQKPGCLDGWWSITGTVIWSLLLFGAFLLNFTLLLAFMKRPGLRTISNRFVMNLTVSNLLTCCVLNPLLMLDRPRAESSASICAIAEGATAFVTISSVFSVLLIAVDQYLAVVDPLRYRTRIDTLKCGIFVFSVWIISLIFGLFAAFNPEPNSLWLICQFSSSSSQTIYPTDIKTKNSSSFIVNLTQEFDDLSFEIEGNMITIDNSSDFFDEAIIEDVRSESKFYITYGLIYATAYTLFAYLLPFIGICWIYINIYAAAHKNSERTRNSGSKAILSCGSFSEEYYPVRDDTTNDDSYHRIPKISSLSSIDESTETTSSQFTRRYLECSKPSPIQEEVSTVLFTVGEQRVDITPQKSTNTAKEISKNNTDLKSEFFDKRHEEKLNVLVESEFPHVPESKRRSSHDIMYDQIYIGDLEALKLRNNSTNEDDTNDNYGAKLDEPLEHDIIKEKKIANSNDDFGNGKIQLKFDEFKSQELKDDMLYSPLIKRYTSVDTPISNEYHDNNERNQVRNSKCNSILFPEDNKVHLTNGNGNENDIDLKEASSHHVISHILSMENFEFDGNTENNLPVVTITPPSKKPTLHRVPSTRSTSSYITSLKYRISNGSLFKYREETRAARVSAFVIVMALICWTPYVVILMLRNLPISEFCAKFSHETNVMALSFFILATNMSPLLFGYRSKSVQRELRRFFCFKKELSYKNNRSLMAKKVLKRRHSGHIDNFEMDSRYNVLKCVDGKSKWLKEKVHFVQVPESALIVETCRSSFSSGASTQISSTSTDDC